MMKLSDYLVKKLEKKGVRHVFMITGGGAMHLDDSFGKSKKINCIFNHNEQATALCAEGYARARGELAVVCVTTGPGGLNCLNGVFGAWTDSAPVLFISGQVKSATTLARCPGLPLRQLGDQEAPITRVVAPLTKYAKSLTQADEVEAVLEEAVYQATTGRPGPVWVDIPLDVQAALIDPKKLKKFQLPKPKKNAVGTVLKKAVPLLQRAKCPLIVAGHGVRLGHQQKALGKLLAQTQIPVVTTFNGFDLIPSAYPRWVGRIGTVGQRAGNFALQNADVILFLGTRNNIRQVSYNWENFAKNAKKIVIDIDPSELKKPTVKPDLSVCADLKDVLPALVRALRKPLGENPWRIYCQTLRKKYPPLREFVINPAGKVHPYYFMEQLSAQYKGPVVMANATAFVAFFQTATIHPGQRAFSNSGSASMGYGLPAAIGACAALGKEVVCLEGDGSIMMNLQELQTVKTNRLPIKIFIIKNGEYSSIIQTQRNFFKGRLTGCNAKSGVEVPDFVKVAQSFGLPAVRLTKNSGVAKGIKKVLAMSGPVVCEVDCTSDYTFAPKLSARKLPDGTLISPTLEDMFPFLDRQEFQSSNYPKK
ncbi:thiamine pyrophosphate-binding protein [Candidatus Avelusimicrobium caledoniensis]|uniref:thiamine pyrophosphate-binding protein n=1 Tax=Candidatus Avelusimicrobium caledoniensis TaxID=3416220 RepID=UPI003D13A96B